MMTIVVGVGMYERRRIRQQIGRVLMNVVGRLGLLPTAVADPDLDHADRHVLGRNQGR